MYIKENGSMQFTLVISECRLLQQNPQQKEHGKTDALIAHGLARMCSDGFSLMIYKGQILL